MNSRQNKGTRESKLDIISPFKVNPEKLISTDIINANIYPGSIGLVGLCWELLGGEHVNPGEWLGPVRLINVTQDDIDTIIDLAKEKDVILTAKQII